jgi:hypothetical protein
MVKDALYPSIQQIAENFIKLSNGEAWKNYTVDYLIKLAKFCNQ